MDDVEKKNINLLFDSTPEEVLNLVERLGEIKIGFTDDIGKITNHDNIFYVNSNREISWQQGVIGTIHPAHLAHPALEYLLTRSSSGDFSVDMAESYEQFEKEVHAYRFIDPFEEGEIGDAIAQKMLDAGFDPLPFKTFHTALMGYVAHHVKRGNFLLPIDLQLGLFQGSVVVQCVVSSAVFALEQVQESFGHTDINHPYKSLLKQCYDSCHILDITHAHNAKKVILTGVWCHDQYALPAGSFLYNSVKRLGVMIQELKKADQLHLVFGKHDSKFNELRFSGDSPRRYGPDEYVETDHPYIVRLIVDHCRKVLDENKEAAPSESEGLVRLLENFEDKALISKLNAKDWTSALKALQDVSTRELLENSINLNSDELQDDVFERVVSSMEGISLDEATQIISGKVEEDQHKQIVKGSTEEEEASTIISGVTDQMVEERTMIKGKREDLGRGPTTVIKGSGADPLAGKGEFNVRIASDWEDKKKAAIGKMRDKWVIAKESGAGSLDIENEMRLAMSEELGISPESVSQLVRNVVTESKDEALAEKNKIRADEIRQKMQEERFKQELAKRDQQILKMKKIMDQVKLELVNKNKATVIQESVVKDQADQEQSQILLQQEISRISKELLDARAQVAQKEKEVRLEVENRERTIKEFENKIEFYKEKSGDVSEQKSEIHGLKRENITLQNQAQLHQTRAENLSQRMDKQREVLEGRDRNEFEKVSSRLAELESERQTTKDQLTRLEFMNRELEKKLLDKENELLRQRQSQTAENNTGVDESYKKALKEIEEFKVRERELQQEAKAQGLRVRQLEQKLKFTTAQLDKQSSKSAAAASSNAPSANEKRLDSINKKLAEGMKNQANELAERKKEAMKLKAENNQLQHKLSDLERQLSRFSKAS